MTALLLNKQLTVNEYYRMAEAGMISQSDKVELINGEIIEMTPIGSLHAGIVNRLHTVLTLALRDRAVVSVQNPVFINNSSEPEPDIALLKYRDDFYAGEHPRPKDIVLIIEVADSSIDYDRDVKVPLYGSVFIPEVWIVNLNDHMVEVYRKPDGFYYQEVLDRQESQTLEIVYFPDIRFHVDDII